MNPTTKVLDKQFTSAELTQILGQAAIYICACPAQVAKLLHAIQEVYAYQAKCLASDSELKSTHETICAALEDVHKTLEKCLADVLVLENWNRETLEMPENLRQLQLDSLDN
jgi:hypothetical protein